MMRVRGGEDELSICNSKGVTVVVVANDGKESGTRLSLGPTGTALNLKK
jgi:hypothetical protein